MSLEKDVLVSESNVLNIKPFSIEKSKYFHKFFYLVGKRGSGKTTLIKNLLHQMYLDYQNNLEKEPELTSAINLIFCCSDNDYHRKYKSDYFYNYGKKLNPYENYRHKNNIASSDDDDSLSVSSIESSQSSTSSKSSQSSQSSQSSESSQSSAFSQSSQSIKSKIKNLDFTINTDSVDESNIIFTPRQYLRNEEELINFLRSKEENNNFEETILVIDNCNFKSRELYTLLNIHSNLKITLILCAQYDILPKFFRNNIDYLFITQEHIISSIQAIFDRYLSVNPYIKSFTELKLILDNLEKYQFIILNLQDPQIFYWDTLNDKENTSYNFESKLDHFKINQNNFKKEILYELNQIYQQLDKIKKKLL